MRKRFRVSKSKSKRSFRRGASKTHKKNSMSVMRGGIRL